MDIVAVWNVITGSASSGILVSALLVLWRVQTLLSGLEQKIDALKRDAEVAKAEAAKAKVTLAKLVRIHATRHPDDAIALYAEEERR
jgi:hypothetical protein